MEIINLFSGDGFINWLEKKIEKNQYIYSLDILMGYMYVTFNIYYYVCPHL